MKKKSSFDNIFLLQLIKPEYKIFWVFVLIYRIINSIVVRVAIHPDEYWQCSEVAYNMVWGGVDLTWEWKVENPIRTYLFPAFYAIFYKLIDILGIDSNFIVRESPFAIQICLTVLTDYIFYKLTKKVLSKPIAILGFWLYLINPCVFLLMTKIFSNTIETMFLIWSVYLVTTAHEKNFSFLKTSLIAGIITFSFVIRNTSAISSLPIVLYHLYKCRSNFFKVFFTYGIISCGVIGFGVYVDYLFYGKVVLTSYNFLMFNVIKGGSENFGKFGWYQYLIEHLPLQLGVLLPFGFMGLWRMTFHQNNKRQVPYISYMIIFTFVVLSLLGHKEYRFTFPMVPFFILVSTYSIWTIFKPKKQSSKWKKCTLSFIVGLVFVSNIIIGMIFIFIAPNYTTVLKELHTMGIQNPVAENQQTIPSAYFLHGCYSGPIHSSMHKSGLELKMMDCRPSFMQINKTQEQSLREPNNLLNEFYQEYIQTNNLQNIQYLVINQGDYLQHFPLLNQYFKQETTLKVAYIPEKEHFQNLSDLGGIWEKINNSGEKVSIYKRKN